MYFRYLILHLEVNYHHFRKKELKSHFVIQIIPCIELDRVDVAKFA